MSVSTRHVDDVGYVEIDNPPVNAIGQTVRQGLLDAVVWAERKRLTRVILSGAGNVFAAGADIREFDAEPIAPHLPDVLNAIDESFVPWVAAIEGVALGGGAEIAMACRMRIMAPSASIGLPEVTLGVIPGAGATARLPRLVGLPAALSMISGGRPVSAQKALNSGLIHEVDEEPLEAAYMINTEALSCVVPSWELPAPENNPGAFAETRARIAAKQRGQIAPLRAVDVIEQGLQLPFHDALSIERTVFLELRGSAQASALRHCFLAERKARAPARIQTSQPALRHVAVVGGGTMGSGIAYAMLSAGLKVTVLETDEQSIQRAQGNINELMAASVKRGLIDETTAASNSQRLETSTEYEHAANVELVIEAAFEDMDVKHKVFAKLAAVLSDKAILATNTSYLDINEIAASLADPSRVIGLHFFAPAHIMKLLEIVKADASSDDALATAYELAKILRKVPVVAGVCDGFIGNRILSRYREAADTVFMDGSTPWEVDEAMVEFGYAMGPYEAQDLSGLDIAYANRRRQDATRDADRRYIPIADRMVDLGKLGKKVGAGWYRYPGGGGKVEDPIVADLAIEEAHFAGLTRTDYTPEEIRKRLLLAMINEAADILDEGIAQSARDIDLVSVFGYGFPRWRGGLMHYADTIGARALVQQLSELAKEDPIVWKPSSLLKRCADQGKTIADC